MSAGDPTENEPPPPPPPPAAVENPAALPEVPSEAALAALPEVPAPAPRGFDGRFRLLVTLGAVIAVLDQIAKFSVVRHFENIEGSRNVVVRGLFDLILTRNPGAAWSMLGNLQPDWLRVAVFISLSLVAIVFIFFYASRAKPEQRLFLWGLGFVLGGAVGNLIDRILAGRVVDFLEFYSRAPWMVHALGCSKGWGCRFPAFNVADVAINIGVGLLILDAIRVTLRNRREAREVPAAVVPPPPADSLPL